MAASVLELADPPPFLDPPDCPSGVFDHGREAPMLSRFDVVDEPEHSLGERIVFALTTVTVQEVVGDPGVLYEDFTAAATDSASELATKLAPPEPTDAKPVSSGPPASTRVYLIGILQGGFKIGIVAPFRPWFEVELYDDDGDHRAFHNVTLAALNAMSKPRDAVRVEYHQSHRFHGYVPSTEDPGKRKLFYFARVMFPTESAMRWAAKCLRNSETARHRMHRQYTVYEDNIPMQQKVMDRFGLVACGWHVLTYKSDWPSGQFLPRDKRSLLVTLEVQVPSLQGAIAPLTADTRRPEDPSLFEVPPLHMAVLDIEVNSGSPFRMADPTHVDEAVVAVSVVYAFAGRVPSKLTARGIKEYEAYERHVYTTSSVCDVIPGVVVHLFHGDEQAMLAAIRRALFVDKQVDVVSGHNILQFDIKFMATRVEWFGSDESRAFMRFGALLGQTLELKTKNMTSSGMGCNVLYTLPGAGFMYLDTLILLKLNFKLRKNTLVYAAEQLLGADVTKNDMPYELIPAVCASANPRNWACLSAYCVQDSIIVLKLVKKLDAVKATVASSRIMNVPMDEIVQCGQQVKVLSVATPVARSLNMVMNGVKEYHSKSAEAAGAQVHAVGGLVFDGTPGLHLKPVVVVDFASLYPSIQQRFNLCWSTIVEDAALAATLEAAGVKVRKHETPTGTFYFVEGVPSVVGTMLGNLKKERTAYKAIMEASPRGSAEYQNADNAQKAIKVPMNSVYGTANCSFGMMPCRGLGTSTCFAGRGLNESAVKLLQTKFSVQVLYGDTDSCMVYFPEPLHIAEGTINERLAYAAKMGHEAEAALNAFFEKPVAVEFEKIYFPFLSSGKKTYGGLKYAPNSAVEGTGHIETKGLKDVRRDAPAFIRAMSEPGLRHLLMERDPDKFWSTVHSTAESIIAFIAEICGVVIPDLVNTTGITLDSFSVTKELKEGSEAQTPVPPQVVVNWRQNRFREGSSAPVGTRMEMWFVVQSDPMPPGHVHPPCQADHVRMRSEILERPRDNILDGRWYIKTIAGLLEQVQKEHTKAIEDLERFANEHMAYIEASLKPTTLRQWCGSAGDRRLPKLCHQAPKASAGNKMALGVTMMTLTGEGPVVVTNSKLNKRPKPLASASAAAAVSAKKPRQTTLSFASKSVS